MIITKYGDISKRRSEKRIKAKCSGCGCKVILDDGTDDYKIKNKICSFDMFDNEQTIGFDISWECPMCGDKNVATNYLIPTWLGKLKESKFGKWWFEMLTMESRTVFVMLCIGVLAVLCLLGWCIHKDTIYEKNGRAEYSYSIDIPGYWDEYYTDDYNIREDYIIFTDSKGTRHAIDIENVKYKVVITDLKSGEEIYLEE